MKKIFTKELYIGLSVIVAIALLCFGIEFLKGINLFKPANFYVAYYQNVQGLEISAPVNINGFKVGQVREINFDYQNPGKTEVVLALNKNLHLPEGSTAMIGATLLGSTYVDITLGTSKNILPVGGTLISKEEPGMMEALKSEYAPKIAATMARVDSLLENLNRLVADPAIAQSIGRLDGISSNLLLASAGLGKTMQQDVPHIMRSARGAAVGLDTITSNLTVLSAQLKSLPLQQTMDNVNATVANLEAFSAQLKNPNSTLGMLMNDPGLYNRLNTVAADVDSLIVDIKRNPKRYISIKLL